MLIVGADPVSSAPIRAPGAAAAVTFRVEVNYVEVNTAGCCRSERKFRPGPEKGRLPGCSRTASRRNSQTFGMVDIPLTPSAQAAVPGSGCDCRSSRDVAVNKQVLDGRLYLILLDDYHVAAAPVPERQEPCAAVRAREARTRRSGGSRRRRADCLRASQDFTQNRRLLLDAIDNFHGTEAAIGHAANTSRMARRQELAAEQFDADQNGQRRAPDARSTSHTADLR